MSPLITPTCKRLTKNAAIPRTRSTSPLTVPLSSEMVSGTGIAITLIGRVTEKKPVALRVEITLGSLTGNESLTSKFVLGEMEIGILPIEYVPGVNTPEATSLMLEETSVRRLMFGSVIWTS